MSGGSMNYLYVKVEDADFLDNTLLRRVFRKHLDKVAAALRSIEWNDSSDGDKDEEKNILACFNNDIGLFAAADLRESVEEATRIIKAIKKKE